MNIPWAFDSWQSFFSMGGHGFYVWISYAVFFGLLGLLVIVSYLQFKHWKTSELRRLARLKLQREYQKTQQSTSIDQSTKPENGSQQ